MNIVNQVNQVKPLPLPPGNLGLPIIGLNRIFQQNPRNEREDLFQEYGAISKTRIRGQKYIYMQGYEAVKFVLISCFTILRSDRYPSPSKYSHRRQLNIIPHRQKF